MFSFTGTEFVRPVVGYFCNLCNVIYASEEEAKDEHCKSPAHREKVKVNLLVFVLIIIFLSNKYILVYTDPLYLFLVCLRNTKKKVALWKIKSDVFSYKSVRGHFFKDCIFNCPRP